MTLADLIDVALEHFLELKLTDTYVGQGTNSSSEWRPRAVLKTRQVVRTIWDYTSWRFKQGNTTATLTSGSATVPANFLKEGPQGGIYVVGQTRRLIYMEPKRLWERRELIASTALPEFYTIDGQDSTTFRYKLETDTTYSGTLQLYYLKKRPTLIDKPAAATVAVGAAGSLSGAYTYKITFVHSDGTESEGGVTSSSVSPSSQQVSLTSIPTAPSFYGVTSRKIYRTAAGGSQHKLLATLSDNTTTTYTDNTVDGSLGANVPTTSQLELIPEEYHESVILPGLEDLLGVNIGDGRSLIELSPRFKAGLFQMATDLQHGEEEQQRLGDYGIAELGMW